MGQKAANALMGRFIGISFGRNLSVIAPISQNGKAVMKTNKKKVKGDLLIDVLVFMILRFPSPTKPY